MKALISVAVLALSLASSGCKDRTLGEGLEEGADCRFGQPERSSCEEPLFCDGSENRRVGWMDETYVRGRCSKKMAAGETCRTATQCASGHCEAPDPEGPWTCK